jgi:two-component system, NtrC family, sensor kinase
MTRIFILFAILFFGFQPTDAQNKIADSLNNQIIHSTSDTIKVLLKIELAGISQFYNSDFALSTVEEAITLAKNIDYTRGELRAISRRGEILHLKGELSKGLEDELSAILLSQKYGYPDIEAESLTFLATIYLDLAEYRKAHDYLFRAKRLYDNIDVKSLFAGAQQIPPYTLSNIGYAYDKLNMLDSAIWFLNASLNFPVNLEDQQRAEILNRIGIVQSRQGSYHAAVPYFKDAIKITKISNDLLNGSTALYQLALIFKEQKNIDSALFYASFSYKAAVKSSFKTAILDASSLLSDLHEAKGNPDSALYYLRTSMSTKESLFGLDELHKLQALVFSEQQRVHQLEEDQVLSKARLQRGGLLLFSGIIILIVFVLVYFNRRQKKVNYLLSEKNLIIEKNSRNLEKTISELKSTQSQLIQSEKMASLGQLTAGIAHEIQNPLNFVNNFSEVSNELLNEMTEEVEKGNLKQVKVITDDVRKNLAKILHHGKRADGIVKGMLQHSRSSSGSKEPTDINGLADEYLRLAFHGFRAKDKSFNVSTKTDFDSSVGKISVVPQDIGRVVLNLITNAFYAVSEKKKHSGSEYEPTVTLRTKRNTDHVLISVIDNGEGIPQKVLDKIFQPFFTTKPTGQGTGLGLSLSYDIVKAHGGELKVETKEGNGSEFIIRIPINDG